MQSLARTTFLVRDYDDGIRYFVELLGFELVEDTALGGDKRWVVVAPQGARDQGLLLAKAVGEQQTAAVGHQAGGRVFQFLHTDDFDRDYALFRDRGVKFREAPRREAYGKVAVFEDLYGNLWDLMQPLQTRGD